MYIVGAGSGCLVFYIYHQENVPVSVRSFVLSRRYVISLSIQLRSGLTYMSEAHRSRVADDLTA
jgi:hypothetical protein